MEKYYKKTHWPSRGDPSKPHCGAVGIGHWLSRDRQKIDCKGCLKRLKQRDEINALIEEAVRAQKDHAG